MDLPLSPIAADITLDDLDTQTSLKYMVLPYVHDLSEKLSGILKPFNIGIASWNVKDLSSFSQIYERQNL